MEWVIRDEAGKMELTDNPIKVLAKEMYIGEPSRKKLSMSNY